MTTYTITVEFTRELDDDSEVLKAKGKRATKKALLTQFCEELQGAYDELAMAGHFTIKETRGI